MLAGSVYLCVHKSAKNLHCYEFCLHPSALLSACGLPTFLLHIDDLSEDICQNSLTICMLCALCSLCFLLDYLQLCFLYQRDIP